MVWGWNLNEVVCNFVQQNQSVGLPAFLQGLPTEVSDDVGDGGLGTSLSLVRSIGDKSCTPVLHQLYLVDVLLCVGSQMGEEYSTFGRT